MVENFSWTDASDDDRIYCFCTEVTEAINDALAHEHQKATYLYMNDAGLGQKIFQNYGPGNLGELSLLGPNMTQRRCIRTWRAGAGNCPVNRILQNPPDKSMEGRGKGVAQPAETSAYR
jgi:hypothetical protein